MSFYRLTSFQAVAAICIFLGLFLAYLSLGAVHIPIIDILAMFKSYIFGGSELATKEYPLASAIVMHIRLPRACAAIMAGGALALAGACTQGLFKNPLASPDVLGVSSGSSFGAVIAIVTGFSFMNRCGYLFLQRLVLLLLLRLFMFLHLVTLLHKFYF